MNKVVTIVQARMGSTRLPGKVLKNIVGRPVLWHVINRLKESDLTDQIVVATTTKAEDIAIVNLVKSVGVECYTGSEADVLDRYFQAAKLYNATTIVRVTSDCPLIDPEMVDNVILFFKKNNFDYVSNTWTSAKNDCNETCPAGLDTEVFSFGALEKAWEDAKLQSEREHVTPYIWKHSDLFRIGHFRCSNDLSFMRLTLDYEEDLIFITEVYNRLSKKGLTFRSDEILALVEASPDLVNLNKGRARNEGYLKSLEKDKHRQNN